MDEHLNNLIFGLAVAFMLPALTFALGMIWSKLVGGWQDPKFRKWWTTFCLLMPFAAFGMMTKRMAEDHFQNLRASWSTSPVAMILVVGLALFLSVVAVVMIVRLWRHSPS